MKSRSIAVFAALMLNGCAGYQLGDVKPYYLRDIKTLAVPTFTNNTYKPRIETLVTNTVIQQLQQDGTYRITTTENADAILRGTITGVARNQVRSVRGNVLATTEFSLVLSIAYTLESRDGKPITAGGAAGATTFFVGSDVTADERQALPIAARDLAVQLTSALSEGW